MTEGSASKAEGLARYASKVNAWWSGNPGLKKVLVYAAYRVVDDISLNSCHFVSDEVLI